LDAEQLSAAGFDVHVYAPNVYERSTDGYTTHALHPWLRYGNGGFVPGVMALLGKYPLVLLHYPFFGGAELLALAKRTGGGKLALTYHMDVVGRGAFRKAFAFHTRFVMPHIVRAADKVIVTSRDYIEHSFAAPLAKERPSALAVVPPSVDMAHFSPGATDTAVCDRFSVDPRMPVVMFTGGLDKAHYFKGLSGLIRAMASKPLEGAQLIVAGEGELRERYVKEADEAGIAERANFIGAVTDEELPCLLRRADVFAFPSVDRSEAFGIAALEALASGVPVVASDLPGVRTVVRDGVNGFVVPPGDTAALTARLAQILGDTALRQRMGEAARKIAVAEYAPSVRQAALVAALSPLLS
jgi:glycosyltransferase involved in cell wall biosynthesis